MTHGQRRFAPHKTRDMATKAEEFKAAVQRRRSKPPRRLDRTPPPGLVVDTSRPGINATMRRKGGTSTAARNRAAHAARRATFALQDSLAPRTFGSAVPPTLRHLLDASAHERTDKPELTGRESFFERSPISSGSMPTRHRSSDALSCQPRKTGYLEKN